MERLSACGAEAGLTGLAGDCLAAEASARPRDAMAVATRVTAYRAGVQERLRAAELARVEAQARWPTGWRSRRRAGRRRASASADGRRPGRLRDRAAGLRRRRGRVVDLPATGVAFAGRRGAEGGRAAARPGDGRPRQRPGPMAVGPRGRPPAARPPGRRAARDVHDRIDGLEEQVERGAGPPRPTVGWWTGSRISAPAWSAAKAAAKSGSALSSLAIPSRISSRRSTRRRSFSAARAPRSTWCSSALIRACTAGACPPSARSRSRRAAARATCHLARSPPGSDAAWSRRSSASPSATAIRDSHDWR